MKKRLSKKPVVMGVFATLERAKDREDPSRVQRRAEATARADAELAQALLFEMADPFLSTPKLREMAQRIINGKKG